MFLTQYGLLFNTGLLLVSSTRLIFSWPVIALGFTGKSLSTAKWELMKPTRRPSISLMTQTIFFWIYSPFINGGPLNLKSVVFGSSWSLPLLVGEGGGLVHESVGKNDPLSDQFHSKQSRESVDLPLTCHLSPSLTTFALGWVMSGITWLTFTLMLWPPPPVIV